MNWTDCTAAAAAAAVDDRSAGRTEADLGGGGRMLPANGYFPAPHCVSQCGQGRSGQVRSGGGRHGIKLQRLRCGTARCSHLDFLSFQPRYFNTTKYKQDRVIDCPARPCILEATEPSPEHVTARCACTTTGLWPDRHPSRSFITGQ